MRRLIDRPLAQRAINEMKMKLADPSFLVETRRIAEQINTAMAEPQFQEKLGQLLEEMRRFARVTKAEERPSEKARDTWAEGLPLAAGRSGLGFAVSGLHSLLRNPDRSRARLVIGYASPSDDPLNTTSDSAKGGAKSRADAKSGVVAAGALGSSALIVEAVQVAGTAILLYFVTQWTGSDGPVEALDKIIAYIRSLGSAGYGVFGLAMVFLQVVPVAAAVVMTISAGAIFGAVKGTLTVLSCSTISAIISFFISRNVGRAGLLEVAKDSKQFVAIDKALGNATFSKSLLLITMIRLSPVQPFSWANYVFGLSPVPPAAFSLGTLIGCIPAVIAYVSAGQVGADVAVNGVQMDPRILALGGVATLGALTTAGSIATAALKDLDIDLGGDEDLRETVER
jgi:uncharacterized membrane protein YdjX (TVP38/TMEM64 family)